VQIIQLDPSSRFCETPASDRRTDRQTDTGPHAAYTAICIFVALAYRRRAVKISIRLRQTILFIKITNNNNYCWLFLWTSLLKQMISLTIIVSDIICFSKLVLRFTLRSTTAIFRQFLSFKELHTTWPSQTSGLLSRQVLSEGVSSSQMHALDMQSCLLAMACRLQYNARPRITLAIAEDLTLPYFTRVFIFFRPQIFQRPWTDFRESLPHDAVCSGSDYILQSYRVSLMCLLKLRGEKNNFRQFADPKSTFWALTFLIAMKIRKSKTIGG